LSFPEQRERPAGSAETLEYFAATYPVGAMLHPPFFMREKIDHVFPTLLLIAESFISGQNNFFALDKGLATLFQRIDRNRREQMFGNYLVYIAREQAERMFLSGRFPYSIYWPELLRNLVEL